MAVPTATSACPTKADDLRVAIRAGLRREDGASISHEPACEAGEEALRIARAKGGDADALAWLLARYRPRVLRPGRVSFEKPRMPCAILFLPAMRAKSRCISTCGVNLCGRMPGSRQPGCSAWEWRCGHWLLEPALSSSPLVSLRFGMGSPCRFQYAGPQGPVFSQRFRWPPAAERRC